MKAEAISPTTSSNHVVDILGNVKGRDQPIMLLERAIQLVSHFNPKVFADEDTVFFDPFCKAGELLLACALTKCKEGAKTKTPSIEDIKKELYHSNRYFALSPDERHHRLSLRTFLGNINSHNEEFNHIIRNGNYVSEEDGRLNEDKFEKEFKSMIDYIKKTSGKKKIVAIGNPPYQESDGGHGASAKLIYPFFVESLIDSKEISEFVLVIPSRWFSGGKNLDDFRDRMLNCGNVKNIVYFERSEDVFPTVHVQGGVCFLNWSEEYKGKTNFGYKQETYNLDLSKFDIIPDDPLAGPIINKITDKWKGQFVADIAWSRKPFGLPTNFFSKNEEAKASSTTAVKCYTKGKKIKYIKRSDIVRNADRAEEWKVAIPKAYATGARRCTLPAHTIFLMEKGAICTETYNIVGSFKTKTEAERLIEYLRTDFCRYLLGLRKLTQDIPKDKWAWVPYLDLSKNWTEKEIYSYFKLTKDEVEHIKKKVEEWS